MKISIENFKSIGSLANYEVRPFTILSGTNSSGKSSFIQLLLLLKQTLEDDSAERALDIFGDYFKVRNYLDLLKGKFKNNKLKLTLAFSNIELSKYNSFYEISFYDAAFDNYELQIIVEFDLKGNQILVSIFEVRFVSKDDSNQENFIRFENKDNSFDIKTDVAVFNKLLYQEQGKFKVKRINYSSFIPTDTDLEFEDKIINPLGDEIVERKNIKISPKLEGIKAILKDFFANLNYIGPLRQAPKDVYSISGNSSSVGIEGENVAEVLHTLSEKPIKFIKMAENEEETTFIEISDTFISAIRYWLCEKFKLCADIYSKREADSYVIYIKSLPGVESTIKHVGFGISQVLPILVEGLLIEVGETLILEQPEIHLHPKVQSQLTDFLLSLVEQGKKVLIETHSDHIITRLRRRIAEDSRNKLDDKVLLTFVEIGRNDILFRNIDIDDYGNFDYYPEDFIDKSDNELKAILKAQMKKRLNLNE